MIPSNKCVLEMRELNFLAQSLLAKGNEGEARKLKKRAEELGNLGLSSDELREKYVAALGESIRPKSDDRVYRAKFNKYLLGSLDEEETRDFYAGTETISYTAGVGGGCTVPIAYDPTLRTALSQVDPVLNEAVTDFTMSAGPYFQPRIVSGYDLSSIVGQLVGETVQQTPQTIPTVAGGSLRSNITFRASLAASLEAEEDIPDFGTKITSACMTALARVTAQHVLAGRGGTDINGIVSQLGGPSQSNATSGKITLSDINNFYFSVNRYYRAAPKAGWLASDGAYKLLRNAVDNSGRPLLNVVDDREMLLGKPIYNCPSLATAYSSIGLTGALIFGDLSHIVIHASRPMIQRSIEQSIADISRGQIMYMARWRCDAVYFDPSGGLFPPLVLAAIS